MEFTVWWERKREIKHNIKMLLIPANQGGEREETSNPIYIELPGGSDIQGKASLTEAKRGEGTCLLCHII